MRDGTWSVSGRGSVYGAGSGSEFDSGSFGSGSESWLGCRGEGLVGAELRFGTVRVRLAHC